MDFEQFKVDLLARLEEASKVAIIGIGADMRNDDAVGSAVATELIEKVVPSLQQRGERLIENLGAEIIVTPKVMIVNGSVVPENHVLRLVEFAPDHAIIIDAAMMGADARPGDLAFIDPGELDSITFSTHTLPLGQFIEILRALGVDPGITVIGIQPASLDYGETLDPAVAVTKDKLAATLHEWLEGAGLC